MGVENNISTGVRAQYLSSRFYPRHCNIFLYPLVTILLPILSGIISTTYYLLKATCKICVNIHPLYHLLHPLNALLIQPLKVLQCLANKHR